MRVVVTGGAGFIGSHLVEALLARGDEVTVVDCFHPFYPAARKEKNLAAASANPRFRLERSDIRDAAAMTRIFERGTDAVVHLAALAGVRPSVERPRDYVDTNLLGTQSILDACLSAKVRKLVFASSSSVYGDDSPRPSNEDVPATQPISTYAATKRSGELLCHAGHVIHGFDITCLRFFTAIGPRQRPDLAFYRFAESITRGEAITLFGDGSSERDYTYVLDIVDGVVRALDRLRGWRVYNLGAGRPIRLDAVVSAMGSALAKKIEVVHRPAQPGDVGSTLADITRARKELGYEPKTPFPDAVEAFVRWFREKDA